METQTLLKFTAMFIIGIIILTLLTRCTKNHDAKHVIAYSVVQFDVIDNRDIANIQLKHKLSRCY